MDPDIGRVRHPSWTDEHVFAMLEHHTVAYCVTSGAHLPCVLRATAPSVYVRLHGPDPHDLYAGSYPNEDLQWWADRLHEWDAAGKDVFVYFNNDGHGKRCATPSHSANCWAVEQIPRSGPGRAVCPASKADVKPTVAPPREPPSVGRAPHPAQAPALDGFTNQRWAP